MAPFQEAIMSKSCEIIVLGMFFVMLAGVGLSFTGEVVKT